MNHIKLLEVYLQGTFLEVRLLGQKVNVVMVLLDIAKFLFIFVPTGNIYVPISPVSLAEYIVRILNFCQPDE